MIRVTNTPLEASIRDGLNIKQVLCRKVVGLAIDPIVHESYKCPKENSNDIALLKRSEKVDLKVYTPACLPALNKDYTGKTGTAYGVIPCQTMEKNIIFFFGNFYQKCRKYLVF